MSGEDNHMRNQQRADLIQAHELENRLRHFLKAGDDAKLAAAMKGEHAADLANALERLSTAQRTHTFQLLAPAKQAAVLKELGPRAVRQLLNNFAVEQIAALIDRLPIDEAAQVLPLFRKRRAEILAAMDKQHAADVQRLLHYPHNSAGRMMTEKFVRVSPNWGAGETLTKLRRMNADVETLTNLYAVDKNDKLLGVVSLREVVVAPVRKKLSELMSTQLVSVAPEADREEVARLISHYDFLALPVLDPGGRILGIIPVDDIIDVLAAENAEDLLKFGAVGSEGLVDEPYFSVPLKTVVTRRVGWLLLLFVAGTFTASVLQFFERELAAVVALSFFIPLLIGTGGNTGAQTVSTLIRGLSTGDVQMKDIWRVIRREAISGLALGMILGVVAYLRARFWSPDPSLAVAVALAIIAICIWANTIAALIPLLAHRFKIDPAAVSAPLITTLVDATGLAIYLFIAKATLNI
jgi:magnesium transporter